MTTTTGPSTPPIGLGTLDRLLDTVSGDRMAATVTAPAGEALAGLVVATVWLAARGGPSGSVTSIDV